MDTLHLLCSACLHRENVTARFLWQHARKVLVHSFFMAFTSTSLNMISALLFSDAPLRKDLIAHLNKTYACPCCGEHNWRCS